MDINGIEQLNILLQLYFNKRYVKGSYNNEVGTVQDIAQALGHPNGYCRNFLQSLAKIGILKKAHTIGFKGKDINTYQINRENLLGCLKKISVFRQIASILYEDYSAMFRDLEGWHKFDKDEIKELQEINNGR